MFLSLQLQRCIIWQWSNPFGYFLLLFYFFSSFDKCLEKLSYQKSENETKQEVNGPYQGVRNVSYSENFAFLLNGWTPIASRWLQDHMNKWLKLQIRVRVDMQIIQSYSHGKNLQIQFKWQVTYLLCSGRFCITNTGWKLFVQSCFNRGQTFYSLCITFYLILATHNFLIVILIILY